MVSRKLFARKTSTLFLFLLLIISFFCTAVQVEGQQGSITFKPDILDGVQYGIEDYSFFFRYGSYYMTFRPYFQWNGQIVTLRQAKQYIDNNYPNARYSHIAQKLQRTIHWGFNYTNLPVEIQQNLEAVYFKLEDYNFPLSVVELEEYTLLYDENGFPILNGKGEPKNGTRFHIPQINLSFDFYDIISQDFDVTVNKTGIAIYNVNGKSDLFLDPITYSAPIITVTGTYSGNLFASILAADTAGGWGQVTADATSTQYLFNCKLTIGDGSTATACSDTGKQIVFNDGISTGALQNLVLITNNAVLTLGELVTSAKKTTKNGCSIITLDTSYRQRILYCNSASQGTLNLYSSTITSIYGSGALVDVVFASSASKVYNCVFSNYIEIQGNFDLYNFLNQNGYYGCGNTGTNERILVTNMISSAYITAESTFSNLIMRQNTRAADIRANVNVYFIDPDIDVWSFSFLSYTGAVVYRQYSFDLTVTYPNGTTIENANVTLTKGAVELTDITDANGQISTQTLTKGYYAQATGDTLQDAGDWTLSIVSAAGNYTNTFPIDEKTAWTIAVTPQIGGGGYTQEDLDEWFVIGGFLSAIIVAALGLAVYLNKR